MNVNLKKGQNYKFNIPAAFSSSDSNKNEMNLGSQDQHQRPPERCLFRSIFVIFGVVHKQPEIKQNIEIDAFYTVLFMIILKCFQYGTLLRSKTTGRTVEIITIIGIREIKSKSNKVRTCVRLFYLKVFELMHRGNEINESLRFTFSACRVSNIPVSPMLGWPIRNTWQIGTHKRMEKLWWKVT